MRDFRRMALLGWLLSIGSLAHARYEAALIKEYDGAYRDAFALQYDRVRTLARVAQLEVSSRLGLIQYSQGFQWPLLIRFEDSAPVGIENAMAYVRLSEAGKSFMQELVINLSATEQIPGEFDRIFYHEMTHAVLNDAVGGQAAMRIPHWVQEGLAQYISEEGRERVKTTASRYKRSQVSALLHPLEGSYTARAYPQYFLAIDAIHEHYSVNAVQAFVRNLIAGRSVTEALEDATGTTWEGFQGKVREHSLKVFENHARPDWERTRL